MTKKIRIEILDGLRDGLQDAIGYERGQEVNLRVTELPAPPKAVSPKEIRRIRKRLNASQEAFASDLNLSTNAVRSWEQGTRSPQHAALKLLAIAKKNPHAFLTA